MQTKALDLLEKPSVKEIERIIEKNYGTKMDLSSYSVFKTSTDEKIWIASKHIFGVDLTKLVVNSIGLYLGKIKRNEKINLSTEGCQLVGKTATKNVAYLGKEEAHKFLQGMGVKPEKTVNAESHNFVIIKSGEDILGSSLFTEEGIKNLLPKSRRVIEKYFTQSKP
jgi:NOL1/NOP2/fmu family ribosome biogenesis protein